MPPAWETRGVSPDFSVVILAGGTGARLGGVDKAGVEYAGVTLLEHCLDACLDASEVVVVGSPVPTTRPVTFVREDPPYGGPAAGLLTGLGSFLRVPTQLGILAVDMPHVTAYTFRRLRRAAAGHDGAALHGPDGRRQLALVVDPAMLKAVAPDYELWHGLALHQLLGPLDLAEVESKGEEAHDIDGFEDLL